MMLQRLTLQDYGQNTVRNALTAPIWPFYVCTIITAGWKCSIKTFFSFFFSVKNCFKTVFCGKTLLFFSRNASIFHRENVSKIHSFGSSQLDSKYFSLSSRIKTLLFQVYVILIWICLNCCGASELAAQSSTGVAVLSWRFLPFCNRQHRTPTLKVTGQD